MRALDRDRRLAIKSAKDGKVIGTFGTYYRDVREPTAREIDAVGTLALTAARALDAVDID